MLVVVIPVPLKWQKEQFGEPGFPAKPAFPVLVLTTKADTAIATTTNDITTINCFFNNSKSERLFLF